LETTTGQQGLQNRSKSSGLKSLQTSRSPLRLKAPAVSIGQHSLFGG